MLYPRASRVGSLDKPLRNLHCFLISSPFPLTEEFLNDSTCGPARTDVRAVVDEPRLNTGIRQCHCAEIPTDPSQPVLQIMNMGGVIIHVADDPGSSSTITPNIISLPLDTDDEILQRRLVSIATEIEGESSPIAPLVERLQVFPLRCPLDGENNNWPRGLIEGFPSFSPRGVPRRRLLLLTHDAPRSVGRHRGDPTCISAVGHCPFEARRKESQSAASIQTGVRSSRPAKSHRAAAGRHAGGGARAS